MGKKLSNYEAILQMSEKQMKAFLDEIYLTGFNTGAYSAALTDDEQTDTDVNPYNSVWLTDEAESAMQYTTEDEDSPMLNALVKSIFLSAGIPFEKEEYNEINE